MHLTIYNGYNNITYKLINAEPSIAEKLKISDNDKVFAINRLRLVDDEPFAVEISYIVYKYAANLTEESINKSGLYNALKQDCGIITSEAIETFEAVTVNTEEAKYFKVMKKDAALYLERFTSADGKIIEYCTSIIRGDKYKYTVKLGKYTTTDIN